MGVSCGLVVLGRNSSLLIELVGDQREEEDGRDEGLRMVRVMLP